MKAEKQTKPWIVTITCPFCHAIVLEAVDFLKIPDDMPDEEREEIEAAEECVVECEHVAFSSDWAYAGPCIPDAWTKEMRLVACAINEAIDDIQPEEVAKIIDDYRLNEDLKKITTKALPTYDSVFIEEFVNKNDGVSGGGGANYGVLLLRKKVK